MYVAHGLLAAWWSCITSFCLTLLPVYNIMGCMSFLNFSFLPFGKTSFVSLTLLWQCLCTMIWRVGYFSWYHLCKSVPQFPWFLCDLLSQVLIWGYGGAKYVLQVLHDESASLHHPYDIGTCPVVTIAGFDYYTVHQQSSSFCWTVTVYRRIFLSIFALIIFSLVGLWGLIIYIVIVYINRVSTHLRWQAPYQPVKQHHGRAQEAYSY